MDNNIIMDLYYGRINPAEAEIEQGDDYRKHSERFLKGMENFSQKLPPELREEFLQLCEDEVRSEEILHKDGFYKGFKTGLALAVQALKEE